MEGYLSMTTSFMPESKEKGVLQLFITAELCQQLPKIEGGISMHFPITITLQRYDDAFSIFLDPNYTDTISPQLAETRTRAFSILGVSHRSSIPGQSMARGPGDGRRGPWRPWTQKLQMQLRAFSNALKSAGHSWLLQKFCYSINLANLTTH